MKLYIKNNKMLNNGISFMSKFFVACGFIVFKKIIRIGFSFEKTSYIKAEPHQNIIRIFIFYWCIVIFIDRGAK